MTRINHYENKTNPLLVLNKASISVQAGRGLYSKPRKDMPKITDFSQVEIALFDNKTNSWLHPSIPLFADFPRLEELLDNYENGGSPVGYNLPVDLVTDLIDYLDEPFLLS